MKDLEHILVEIYGCKIACLNKENFEKLFRSYLLGNEKRFIAKINTEFLRRVQKNNEFRKIIDSTSVNIVDGVGVQWAAKYLSIPMTRIPVLKQIQAIYQMVYSGASLVLYPKYCTYPINDRFPGITAFRLMLRIADETGSGIYFLGGREDVLDAAVKQIKKEFPNLQIAGSCNGYDKKEKAVELINKTDAKLLFVGLGSPEQEEWIVNNLPELNNIRVAVGEGGTIDRVANPIIKSPKIFSILGVEWLWRAIFNKNLTTNAGPRVIRVWNSVPKFIIEIVKYKIINGPIEVKDEKN